MVQGRTNLLVADKISDVAGTKPDYALSEADTVIDSVFCTLYIGCFLSILYFSIRAYRRNKTIANLSNVLVVGFLLSTLADRTAYFVIALATESNNSLGSQKVEEWLFFEAPFYFINAASLVLFFEMMQLALILRNQGQMQNAEDNMADLAAGTRSEIEENANLRGSFVAQMAANAVRTTSGAGDPRDAVMDATMIVEEDRQQGGYLKSLPRSQKASLLSLVVLFGLITAQLIAALTGDSGFIGLMTWIMSISYMIIAVAFLPLFLVCLYVTKRTYPDLYDAYLCKAVAAFTTFGLLVAFRLTVYLLIIWNMADFDPREMHYEIPFFVSEILISMCYIFGLYRVYNQGAPEDGEFEVDEALNENLMVHGATLDFHERPLHERKGESLYQNAEGVLYRQPLEGGSPVPVPDHEAETLRQSVARSSRLSMVSQRQGNKLEQSYELRQTGVMGEGGAYASSPAVNESTYTSILEDRNSRRYTGARPSESVVGRASPFANLAANSPDRIGRGGARARGQSDDIHNLSSSKKAPSYAYATSPPNGQPKLPTIGEASQPAHAFQMDVDSHYERDSSFVFQLGLQPVFLNEHDQKGVHQSMYSPNQTNKALLRSQNYASPTKLPLNQSASQHPAFSLSSSNTIEEADEEDAIGNKYSERPQYTKPRLSHLKDDDDSSSDEFDELNITYLNPHSPENKGLNKAIFSQAQSNELTGVGQKSVSRASEKEERKEDPLTPDDYDPYAMIGIKVSISSSEEMSPAEKASVNKDSVGDDQQFRASSTPSAGGHGLRGLADKHNSSGTFNVGQPLSPTKSGSSLGGHLSAFLDASNTKAKRKKTKRMIDMSLK